MLSRYESERETVRVNLIGPSGTYMKSYPHAQLEAFCRMHPVRRKILLVPNRQIGRHMVDEIVRSGVGVLNLDIKIPADLADDIAGPELRSLGYTPLPSADVEQFWIEGIVSDSFRENPDGFFSGLRPTRGLIRSFLRTIRLLRHAEIRAESLLESDSNRLRSIGDIQKRYERLLEEKKVYDRAAAVSTALRIVTDNPERRGIPIAILDQTGVDKMYSRLIDALSEGALHRIGLVSYESTVPVDFAAAEWQHIAPLPCPGVGVATPGKLLATHRPPVHYLELRAALGSEYEVEGILQEIVGKELPLEDIEIVYTQSDPYIPLLFDYSDRLGIPLTFSEGYPAMLTLPGRRAAAWLEWMIQDFSLQALAGGFRAGLHGISGSDDLATHSIPTILLQIRYPAGRHTLSQLAQAGVLKKLLPGESVEPVREELSFLDKSLPSSDIGLTEFLDILRSFLVRYEPREAIQSKDAAVLEAVLESIQSAANEIDDTRPLSAWATYVSETLKSLSLNQTSARPGHAFVVPLDRSGYSGRKYTFVLGLDEGTFPGSSSEDPVLLDSDRSNLSPFLKKHGDGPIVGTWQLVRMLGSSPGTVTLVSRVRDALEGSQVYPSPLFHLAMEWHGIEKTEELTTFGPIRPAGLPLTVSQWTFSNRRDPKTDNQILGRYPALASGALAERHRTDWNRPEFRGWLGRSTPEIAIESRRSISPSALEHLTACPYRYFLKYVLGLRPVEEAAIDPARWLTPAEFGKILHEVFRRFMSALHETGSRPDSEQHRSFILDLLNHEIESHKQVSPPPNPASYEADSTRLMRAVEIFLSAESAETDGEPVGFEVAFGQNLDDGWNVPEPVHIELSRFVSMRLSGSIDRVDRAGTMYRIWDYKTGSAYRFDANDLGKNQQNLQWILYAFALEEILKMKGKRGHVQTSGYFFPTEREYGLRIDERVPTKEQVAASLEPYFRMVRSGTFLRVQKQDACTFCDFARVCAGEKVEANKTGFAPELNDSEWPFMEILEAWRSNT